MDKKISSGLKTTFIIHVIVGAIFGITFIIYPQMWNALGAKIQEPGMYRLVGAAILGYAFSSWWAYRETAWEKVKIVVQMEIIWTGLGALVLLWGLLFAGRPAIEWMNFVIMAGFAIAFYYFFTKH